MIQQNQLRGMISQNHMLTTIAAVLIVLWLIGYIGFPVLGSFVHILLLIAVIFFLIRIIRGENPLK
jgi:hypothetical protein